jgi:two-component system phosphate regulon sensor histidine kinase PhoR
MRNDNSPAKESGPPIPDPNAPRTAGPVGPVLFQDHPVTGKRSRLDRERSSAGGNAGHPESALTKLAVLIRRDRERLLSRWRQEVRALPSAQHLDAPTLDDHIPALLEELAEALATKSDETIAEALREGSPPEHGLQRLEDGFDIVEVVAEYNILRGCIHDLAEANGLSLAGTAFHILNRVLDGSIGLAVEAYAKQSTSEIKHRREEYLAFVAHDLRTPLQAIALAASEVERALPAPSTNADGSPMIKTLQRNVRRLEALVGKVLEENKNPELEGDLKLERRSFDLWPLVQAVIQDTQPIAGTTSTRLLNMVPDDLVVFADAGLLRRVLQNLLDNAIAHTPRGEVRIGARDMNGTIECWVSDNGAGIPRNLLHKVFEKDAGGLGLAIVKTLVEAHEGTVELDSEEGRETIVRFTLPSRRS